jgi:hypothetical protein
MMAQIVVPVSPTNDTSRLQVNIHVQAEVLPAEIVRRRANAWLLEHVGNLLRAESPELVLGDPLVWRVDIVLTSPSRGRIGCIGRLTIDATSNEVLADETLAQEMMPLVQAFTGD